jgi:hypothetical protein
MLIFSLKTLENIGRTQNSLKIALAFNTFEVRDAQILWRAKKISNGQNGSEYFYLTSKQRVLNLGVAGHIKSLCGPHLALRSLWDVCCACLIYKLLKYVI